MDNVNVVLWILQVLLAAFFLAVGLTKLSQPREKLAPRMGWVETVPAGAVKGIGALEVLAGLGLILPAVTGIATILTPLAAVGLALIMVGAVVVHARRKEPQVIGMNVVLLIVAVIVAWGRFGPYHF